MKRSLLAVLLLLGGVASAQVVSWENDPSNWKNNEFNWNNSSSSWNNNPNNWNNNPNNYNANNGVYDNQGNRQGYAVPSPSGTVNYFDNQGNRQAYVPYGR